MLNPLGLREFFRHDPAGFPGMPRDDADGPCWQSRAGRSLPTAGGLGTWTALPLPDFNLADRLGGAGVRSDGPVLVNGLESTKKWAAKIVRCRVTHRVSS